MSAPFQNPAEYRAWNDAMILKHDPAAYYANRWVRLLERARLRAIQRGLKLARGREAVLELGCGFGFVLRRIALSGGFRRILGMDLSLPSLRDARERIPQGVGLTQGDGAAPPFRLGAFDAVCMTEVIEHVPDPVALLRASRGLLAPGGVLVVTAPNERVINRLKCLLRRTGLWRLFFGRYEAADRMEEEWHLHAMDRGLLVGWLAEAGYEVRKVQPLPAALLPMRYLAVGAPVGAGDDGAGGAGTGR